MVNNLYPQRWLDQLPGDGKKSIPPEEMPRAAQAETRAEHGRGRHATKPEAVRKGKCARRGQGQAGVVIPRALLESVTARIAHTMKRRSKSESEHRELLVVFLISAKQAFRVLKLLCFLNRFDYQLHQEAEGGRKERKGGCGGGGGCGGKSTSSAASSRSASRAQTDAAKLAQVVIEV